MSTDDAAVAPPQHRSRPLRREVPFLLVLALVLALVIKTFLLQAFSIPSGSMQHTLEVGDRVLVNKLVYRVRDIHRGEVVVFNGIDDWAPESDVEMPAGELHRVLRAVGSALGVTSAGEKDYIKRVIGLPGDRVMCCSASGHVVITPPGGSPVELSEPYLLDAGDAQDPLKWFCQAGTTRATCPPGSAGLTVPVSRLWVMGDHRGASADSRAHLDDTHHGTIPVNRVVGRAFVVVYPLGHGSVLGVPPTFTALRSGDTGQRLRAAEALGAQAVGVPGGGLAVGLAGALPVALLRRRRLARR